jgi:predicted XRE-type DNA-binding protein
MATTSNDPVVDLRKQLASEIVRALGPKSQHLLAPRFGIPQPRMSELSRGRVDRCSVEWLIRRIHRLGGSVSVTVALGDVQREWTVRQFAERRSRKTGVPRQDFG